VKIGEAYIDIKINDSGLDSQLKSIEVRTRNALAGVQKLTNTQNAQAQAARQADKIEQQSIKDKSKADWERLKAIEAQEKAAQRLEDAKNRMGLAAKRSAEQMTNLDKAMGRVQRTMLSLAAVVAARWTKDLFLAPVKAGVEFNQVLEDTRIGIASLLYATTNYTSILTGKLLQGQEAWNAALKQSGQIQIELQAANLRTAATYDQILRAFNEALPYGKAAKFNDDEILQFTESVVKAASAMRVPLDMLNEEMRSMLSGTMNPRNTRLYPLMIAAGLTNDKIKELRKEGKLFNAVMAAMEGTTKGAESAMNTFSVRLSNLKDAFAQLSGQAFSGTFETLKQSFKDLTDTMVKVSKEGGQTTFEYNERIINSFRLLDSIISTLIKAFTNLGLVIDELRKNYPTLMTFAEIFGSIAIQLGVAIVAVNVLGRAFGLLFAAGKWLFTGGIGSALLEFGASATGAASAILGPAGLTIAVGALIAAFLTLGSEIEVNGLKIREWIDLAGSYIEDFANKLTGGMYDAWNKVAENYPNAISALESAINTMKEILSGLFSYMESGFLALGDYLRNTGVIAQRMQQGQPYDPSGMGGATMPGTEDFDFFEQSSLANKDWYTQEHQRKIYQNSMLEKRRRILSGDAAREKQRRGEISNWYSNKDDIWKKAALVSSKDIPDTSKSKKGKGGGPLDYEDINQYIDQFQKKMERLIQSLNNLFQDYYIQLLEDSGRFYEAEDIKTQQRIDQQKYAYTQMLESASDYVRELEEKISKRGSKDPKLDESLLKAQEERDNLLSKEEENIKRITEEESRRNAVAKERIELQDRENLAQLNSQYKELVGTLEDRAKAENDVLKAQLAQKQQGITSESDPLKQQILYMEMLITKEKIRRNELKATGTVLDGLKEGFTEIARNADKGFEAGKQMAQGLTDSFETFFSDVLTKSKSFGDAFKDLWKSILNEFVNMQVKSITNSFSQIMGSLFGMGNQTSGSGIGIGNILSSLTGLSSGQQAPYGPTQSGGNLSSGAGGIFSILGSLFGGGTSGGGGLFTPTLGIASTLGGMFGGGGIESGIGGLGGSLLGGLAGPSLLSPVLGALSPALAGITSSLGMGSSILLGSFAGPIGMIIGGILGGVLGGMFGEEEPKLPSVSMRFGKGKSNWSGQYGIGGSVSGMPAQVGTELSNYFDDWFDELEEKFWIDIKSVFEKHPGSIGFEVEEGASPIKLATKAFIKKFGLYLAEEIVGPTIFELFGASKDASGEYSKKNMSKAGTEFMKFIRSLRESNDQPLSEVFTSVMDILDFLPDGIERMQDLITQGWNKTEAFDEIEDQVNWFKEKFFESFSSASATALDTMDWDEDTFKTFKDTFTQTIGSVILSAFKEINFKSIKDTFLEILGDPLFAIRDLFKSFAQGEISNTQLQTDIASLFVNLQGMYTQMQPAMEAMAEQYESFTLWLEQLLGIDDIKREEQTKSLEDIIKYADMTDFDKAMEELKNWYDEQKELALRYGTDLNLLEQAYNVQKQEIIDQYADEITGVWEDMLQEIIDIYNDIKYSSLNVMLPVQKAQEAMKDYTSLFNSASSGDATAVDEYLGFVKEYLQLQQDAYKSSIQYQQIYASTMEDLLRIQNIANSGLDTANTEVNQYADGGIASGPTSGYMAMLHGTEAIIPLNNGKVPVEITGGSNSQPIYVTVEVAGEEFEALIDRRADNIRVKAQKRKGAMNERRAIY